MANERWQYQVVDVKGTWRGLKSDEIQIELNKLGQSGWELVAVRDVAATVQAYLKRPA